MWGLPDYAIFLLILNGIVLAYVQINYERTKRKLLAVYFLSFLVTLAVSIHALVAGYQDLAFATYFLLYAILAVALTVSLIRRLRKERKIVEIACEGVAIFTSRHLVFFGVWYFVNA